MAVYDVTAASTARRGAVAKRTGHERVQIYESTNQIQRVVMARALLG